jgi:hypothetical protein
MAADVKARHDKLQEKNMVDTLAPITIVSRRVINVGPCYQATGAWNHHGTEWS